MTDPDYGAKGRAHCARFIEQIRTHYGAEPTGGRLFIKSNPHDFGNYYSVEYGWSNDKAAAYGFDIEADRKNALCRWDPVVA
jgi:hypothetical protein|tara:strand:+ start:222 stop:467 length:246 start_codon:yes stop_codon:yes gene_type:complete